MSELRRDPIGGRWVIVNTDAPMLPKDFEHDEARSGKPSVCPFCYGNESLAPAEIAAIRTPGTSPNTSGWQTRAIPNKFPALQVEGNIDRRGQGVYDLSNGVGAHEVIVETPYHNKDFPDLLVPEISGVFNLCCQRMLDLERDKRLKYILLFKNYGLAAGASLEHPHTQLIALPMVPKSVKEELEGAQKYYRYRERCIFCDMIRQEIDQQERIVLENRNFLAFCPFVSRFPFEIWIMPKRHTSLFSQTQGEEMADFSAILKTVIAKIKKLFGDTSYNFMIHSAPMNSDGAAAESFHWHLEFMPKLTRIAGFEWGTGFYLVPTPPEVAAKFLRDVKID